MPQQLIEPHANDEEHHRNLLEKAKDKLMHVVHCGEPTEHDKKKADEREKADAANDLKQQMANASKADPTQQVGGEAQRAGQEDATSDSSATEAKKKLSTVTEKPSTDTNPIQDSSGDDTPAKDNKSGKSIDSNQSCETAKPSEKKDSMKRSHPAGDLQTDTAATESTTDKTSACSNTKSPIKDCDKSGNSDGTNAKTKSQESESPSQKKAGDQPEKPDNDTAASKKPSDSAAKAGHKCSEHYSATNKDKADTQPVAKSRHANNDHHEDEDDTSKDNKEPRNSPSPVFQQKF